MPAHLLSPERRAARLVGALALALGAAVLAFVLSSGSVDDGTKVLVSPAAEDTEPTVLGEVIDRTTLPDAPPASAIGFTTTTASSDGDDEPVVTAPAPTTPPPTLGPPVSITRPPRPTTTTTAPPPACSDGVDNDGDGSTDAADPGCTDPNDGDETDSPPATATSG